MGGSPGNTRWVSLRERPLSYLSIDEQRKHWPNPIRENGAKCHYHRETIMLQQERNTSVGLSTMVSLSSTLKQSRSNSSTHTLWTRGDGPPCRQRDHCRQSDSLNKRWQCTFIRISKYLLRYISAISPLKWFTNLTDKILIWCTPMIYRSPGGRLTW